MTLTQGDLSYLRDLLEQKVGDYVNHHKREHELLEQAGKTADHVTEMREAKLNELRNEVLTDRSQFITKSEFSAFRDETLRRLSGLELSRANGEGKQWMFLTAIGIILTVLTIALRFLIK